ncbi:acyltransferase [Vibrio splendidus]|uniref:O-acetyltransferase n=1 Tax=Vibrio splendidus TaxID=29497 RepID=A0A2N7FBB9_VIBSP|nr:acyltransferase [Vibrio splendidus]OMO27760.1 O-acetyltransferase [Vibrio splendidus]PMH10156.1 O-acetyltransferase [Vibrio splendidus]PMJ65743.1 O-acetyltransferase [Vibrio splendidus]PMK11864.1 O-acetyltransferase [Vibrio splendidus]PMK60407.1 O-acetyltransferase [Vibrio splendidus]
MAYLTQTELLRLNFKSLGKNVKISDKASIYNHEMISIGDNSRIDDFCVISGVVEIGKFVHITPMCLIAGGEKGAYLADFCTLAYGVKVFTQTDDYTGETMTNSLIPKKYKNEKSAPVYINKYVIIGTNSVVFPGVTIDTGCSIGAVSLVLKSTDVWGVYIGSPATKIKERKRNLLQLKNEFLSEYNYDSI